MDTENNTNWIWWIIGIIVVFVLIYVFAFRGKDAGTNGAATSTAATSTEQVGTSMRANGPMSIEDFVKQNISALSPIKEQLGGKFYVTSIEAHGGIGTVEYEDGHNAYTADFTYEIDENGVPTVTAFIPRSKG